MSTLSEAYRRKYGAGNVGGTTTSASSFSDAYRRKYGLTVQNDVSLTPEQTEYISNKFKASWTYDELDPEDIQRKAQGIMPKAVEAKYDSSDAALKEQGLPAYKDLGKYYDDYNEYSKLESFKKDFAEVASQYETPDYDTIAKLLLSDKYSDIVGKVKYKRPRYGNFLEELTDDDSVLYLSDLKEATEAARMLAKEQAATQAARAAKAAEAPKERKTLLELFRQPFDELEAQGLKYTDEGAVAPAENYVQDQGDPAVEQIAKNIKNHIPLTSEIQKIQSGYSPEAAQKEAKEAEDLYKYFVEEGYTEEQIRSGFRHANLSNLYESLDTKTKRDTETATALLHNRLPSYAGAGRETGGSTIAVADEQEISQAYADLLENGYSERVIASAFQALDLLPQYDKVKKTNPVITAQKEKDAALLNLYHASELGREQEALVLSAGRKLGQDDFQALEPNFREQAKAEGYTDFEVDNILRRMELGDYISTEEQVKHFVFDQWGDVPEEQKELIYMGLNAGDRALYAADMAFSAETQTGISDQTVKTLITIPIRAAGSIVQGVGGLIDMVVPVPKFVDQVQREMQLWQELGHDKNHKVISVLGDVGVEVLRMYATYGMGQQLGTLAGTALGGYSGTGLGVVLTKAANMTPFMLNATGNYYLQALNDGASRSDAITYGIIAGVIEGATESFGADAVFSSTASKKVLNALPAVREALSSPMGQRFARVVVAGLENGVQEGASYLLTGIAQRAIYSPELSFDKNEFWTDVGMGALVGVLGASLSSVNWDSVFPETKDSQSTDSQSTAKAIDYAAAKTEVDQMPEAKIQARNADARTLTIDEYREESQNLYKSTKAILDAEEGFIKRKADIEAFVQDKVGKLSAANKRVAALINSFPQVEGLPQDQAHKLKMEWANQREIAEKEVQAAQFALEDAKKSAESQLAQATRERDSVVSNNTVLKEAAQRRIDDHNIAYVAARNDESVATTGFIADLGANTWNPNREVSQTRTNTFEAILTEAERALDDLAPDQFTYGVVSEAQSLEAARWRLSNMSFEQNRETLLEKGQWDGADFDTAMAMLSAYRSEAAETGDYFEVYNWMKIIQSRSTSAAQFLQAHAKYSRTVEGVVMDAVDNVQKAEDSAPPKVRKAINDETKKLDEALKEGRSAEEAVNEAMPKKDAKQKKKVVDAVADMIQKGEFTPEKLRDIVKDINGLPIFTDEDIKAIEDFYKQAQEATNERDRQEALYRAGMVAASKLGPGTLRQKIRALRYMSMLLNAKTGVKNFAANLPMFVLETLKDLPGTVIDKMVENYTGKRTTTAFSPERYATIVQSAFKGLSDSWLDLKHDVNTSFLPGRVENARVNTFRSESLNRLERLVGQWMGVGDRMWAQMAYDGRLAELKTLGVDISTPEAAHDAYLYALDRVFQNNSDLAKIAVAARKDLGIIGDMALPFAQTPANIADKLLDYSPIGLTRAIRQWGITGKTNEFNQKLFVDRISRSLTGTGILFLGAVLKKAGILLVAPKNEEEREMYKNAGIQAFSLKLGDTYHTVEWTGPVGALMIMGATIHDILSEEEVVDMAIASDMAARAVMASVNCFFDNSFLSAIATVMTGDSPAGALWELALSTTSSVVPSIVGAAARTIDPYERDTYDPNSFIKQAQYILSRIPGLRQLLPEKIATDGTLQEATSGKSFGGRLFNNIFNPAYSSIETDDAVHAEIFRLYQEGFTEQILPSAPKTISGTKLTSEQRAAYQEMLGAATYAAVEEVINRSLYKNWSDEEKAEELHDAITSASSAVRTKFIEQELR